MLIYKKAMATYMYFIIAEASINVTRTELFHPRLPKFDFEKIYSKAIHSLHTKNSSFCILLINYVRLGWPVAGYKQ